MQCPFCSFTGNKVVDKRSVSGLGEIRRRRECLKCGKRFTTYERVASVDFLVIKKDGRKEAFSKEKLFLGIVKALEKRPGMEGADGIACKIEQKLRRKGDREVPSTLIGKMVLAELKKMDRVAYLRFASVYRRFDGVEDFTKEMQVFES